MSKTVLILGASGRFGSHAAVAFGNAGWSVRRYDRASGDMVAAARGADVIVNGLNPPNYHDWAGIVPAITKEVIAAAKASGATVVLPGNVYNFGAHEGEMNEHTPQRPNTGKGAIRVAMEDSYRVSGVQTIVLRAGNVIDPNGNGDVFSALLLRGGTRVINPGDAGAMQPYAYAPDWARAAVMLAERRRDLAAFEDIPFPGHTFTFNDLHAHVAARTGDSGGMRTFPWWAMRLAAPFVELARELLEMRYLYSLNHWLGSEKFQSLLPDFEPTPLDVVLSAGLDETSQPGVGPNSARATDRTAQGLPPELHASEKQSPTAPGDTPGPLGLSA